MNVIEGRVSTIMKIAGRLQQGIITKLERKTWAYCNQNGRILPRQKNSAKLQQSLLIVARMIKNEGYSIMIIPQKLYV